MILSSYSQFRRHFSSLSAATDGLPAWPGPVLPDGSIDNSTPSSIRASGFSGTMIAKSQGGHVFQTTLIGPLLDPTKIPDLDGFWPFEVTVSASVDAVPPIHDYDWFLSQRRDVGRYPAPGTVSLVEYASPAFTVTMPNRAASGRISVQLSAYGLSLCAGADSLTCFATLFRNTHLYCLRRADSAVQWARLYDT